MLSWRTMQNEDDTRQNLALVEETVTSMKLLQRGLAELEGGVQADDFFQSMLQSLSSGFEHLLKLVLIFHELHVTGKVSASPWPPRTNGHDVQALLDLVIERCFDPSFYPHQAPAVIEDVHFLRCNGTVRRLMGILSHFGMQGRYHDLDLASGRAPTSEESPSQEYDRLEGDLMGASFPDWANRIELGVSAAMEMERAVTAQVIATCRRTARALVRLFTLSPLDKEAGYLTSIITPFLFLRDEDL